MLASFLISAVYIAVCVLVFYQIEQHKEFKIPKGVLWAMVALAAGIRIFFALQDYFFTYDMNCFVAWGSYARSLG